MNLNTAKVKKNWCKRRDGKDIKDRKNLIHWVIFPFVP